MERKARVGILGGGQHGRLLALTAHKLDMTPLIYDPDPDACAGLVAEHVVAPFADLDALGAFAEACGVVTYEFENVPLEALEALSSRVNVQPCFRAFQMTSDRLLEKQLLGSLGIPTTQWMKVSSLADTSLAAGELGPVILKTRRGGYDGKGQCVAECAVTAANGWMKLGRTLCIAERIVRFERELSLTSVRSASGETRFYPLVQNKHQAGILRLTHAPAPNLSEEVQNIAEAYAIRVLDALDYVGVLTIEFFETEERLLANEIAPRVHNSGHWTIEGAQTSQFENHLRAISGLPLGSTEAKAHSATRNLLGKVPDLDGVLVPGVAVHVYGKSEAPNRMVGHITTTAETSALANLRLARAQWLMSAALGLTPPVSLYPYQH